MPEILEFKATPQWDAFERQYSWLSFVPEFATTPEGIKLMRGRGRAAIYKIVKEHPDGREEYQCTTCKSDILAAQVAHPIWDSPIPCSGSGRVHNETVPYCPKCEQKPDFNGTPIEVGEKFR